MIFLKQVVPLSLFAGSIILSSTLAFSQSAPIPSVSATTTEAATSEQTSQTFISDGAVLSLSNLNMTITPPRGWEVMTNTAGISVLMQEQKPKEAKPDYSKPVFQRNITVAMIPSASPIDEMRAASLSAELVKAFGSDGRLKDYQITEHKFFDYHGKNDGLVVYAAMTMGDFKMMQVNVLVSGSDRQFMMTYTDFADMILQAGPAYTDSWNSMASITVLGDAPQRYQGLVLYSSLGVLAIFGIAAATILRRRSQKRKFESDAQSFDDEDSFDNGYTNNSGDSAMTGSTSMIATLAGEWKLARRGYLEDNDSFQSMMATIGRQ